ncbi:copper-translocating P-t [Backusella circina FSU 941]|nr:copper-translocating P-t [Backusella circina FSU 941]
MSSLTSELDIPIEGMTCNSCVQSITLSLEPLVESVHVDLATSLGHVVFNANAVSLSTLITTIEDCGFDVPLSTKHVQLSVEGMTCQSCVRSIHGALSKLEGIQSVLVRLGSVSVDYDPQQLSETLIVETIEDCGFDVNPNKSNTGLVTPPVSTHNENGNYNSNYKNSSDNNRVTAQFKISGMTCASCVNSIERGLAEQTILVSIALLSETATITYDNTVTSPDALIESIGSMGFDATLIQEVVSNQAQLVLQIYGMTCASCVNAIEKGVSRLPGITRCSVNLMTETGVIHHDPSVVGAREIINAIENLGSFNAIVSDRNRNIQLESLTKVREIQAWRRAFLTSLIFAIPVFVIAMCLPDIPAARPLLDYPFPGVAGLFVSDILQWLLATPVQFWIGKRFIVSAYLSLKHRAPTMDVLVALSTLSAYFFSILSMTRSILLASGTRPALFFDTSTMLISFILLGRYLENVAKGKSSSALSKLLSLTPSTALLQELDAVSGKVVSEKKIPSELVELNDHLKIVPGDKIPTDGILVSGDSSIDESMITGEVEPVPKKAGDAVIGGTVNGLGTFVMRATRVGSDTALSQIVSLVENAQVNKAPIQGFTDKVAGVFVPVVLALGLSTLIIWSILVGCFGVERMPRLMQHEIEGSGNWFFVCLKLCISVIIVACPCALGLATPTAVMVGTGLGAEVGVLFKGGAVLENGQRVNKVVFDKTGTLTLGKVQVVNYQTWHTTINARDMIIMAAAAESHSEHLLGRAIVNKAKALLEVDHLDSIGTISGFQSETGYGIECTLTGYQNAPSKEPLSIVIGNQLWLEEHHGIALSDEHLDLVKQEFSQGFTSILVAIQGVPVGFISVSDVTKPEARYVVAALHRMGIETAMVTGDNRLTAECIAAKVGISEVHAGISPQGKSQLVENMQNELIQNRNVLWGSKWKRKVVAMVGDGINDSPALVTSDFGIALCSGTDIAMEAADVVLMRNDLADVVVALVLSKKIFKRIKMNLLWACVYNILGIPLAMGIFMPLGYHLHPMMAGMAMAASSTSVVLSSLTLRWFWRKPDLEIGNDEDDNERHSMISTIRAFFRRRGAYEPVKTQDYDLENLSSHH